MIQDIRLMRAILLVFVYLLSTGASVYSNERSKLVDKIPNRLAPAFVTFTTGHSIRLSMTKNLLVSLAINSPALSKNAVLVCLDEEACKWCNGPFGPQKLQLRAVCYCKSDDTSTSTTTTVSTTDVDTYASAVWSRAVLMKVEVAKEIADAGLRAVLCDHDVVIRGSLDGYFDGTPEAWFGEEWSRIHKKSQDTLQPEYGGKPGYPWPSPGIVTMCDFSRNVRPGRRDANTGFMLINSAVTRTGTGTDESDAAKSAAAAASAVSIINEWVQSIKNEVAAGRVVDNDQPPFQRIVQQPKYLASHRCADENEGLAMWFHKKGKLTGSKRNRDYYFYEQEKIRVFHANDVKVSDEKANLLMRLAFWYLDKEGNPKAELEKMIINGKGMGSEEFSERDMGDYLIHWIPSAVQTSKSVLKTKPKPPSNARFYVYPWSSSLTDLVPFSAFQKRVNNGAGPLIDKGRGQFNTYMHSLFPLVMARLMHHPLRTEDPSEATWFFIPYDVSSDAYHYEQQLDMSKHEKEAAGGDTNNGSSRLHVTKVKELLSASPYFKDNGGSSHFFIDSSEPFWYEKKNVVESFYKFCKSCLKFTPSTIIAPFQQPWAHKFPIDSTYVHIPYTSTWHYIDRNSIGSSNTPQDKGWAWTFDPKKKRPNLVAFVGIVKKMNVSATWIRKALVKECQLSLSKDFKKENQCALRTLGPNSWRNFGDEAALYTKTTFCLLPQGDIPSRKAIFDMLLAGCIPVIFDTRQISLYKWHIGETIERDISVNIQVKSSALKRKSGKNKKTGERSPLNFNGLIQTLSMIPDADIIAARRAILSIGWQLQYSIVPSDHTGSWSPPFPDAVDVIVDNVLSRQSSSI